MNWDSPEQMLSYADQEVERFAWDEVIEPAASSSPWRREWHTIATPGHDMGSLVLYSPRLKILISADALWEHSSGFRTAAGD